MDANASEPLEADVLSVVASDIPPPIPAGTGVGMTEPQQNKSRVFEIELFEPITVKGREVTTLQLDFRRLRPRALRNIESEIHENEGNNPIVMNPYVSATYGHYLGARAAGITLDEFDTLEYEDNVQVMQAVQDFFAKSVARYRGK